ncbi:outer membrane protein transport protein [Weeksellaceae bacterium TAE3-ERU29]|nr:outer membrane protein transport protein [Weeksellaceae bacterium TAE3-ERU29]
MKHIKLSCIGLLIASGLLNAQSFNPDYIEGLYRYGENDNLSGTARYKALNGSMGALGGDLSSTIDNPAGGAVFLISEANLTLGVNNGSLDIKNGNKNPSNSVGINQAGAVMVFNNQGTDKWKGFAIGLNYQKNNDIDETLDLNTNIKSNNLLVNNNYLKNIYYNEVGNSSLTNMSFSGNYDNKIYFGLGFNFHQYTISNRADRLEEFSNRDNQNLSYIKDFTPSQSQGNGFSIGLGVISKVSKNIRLGLSYESPKWYSEVIRSSVEYYIENGKDPKGQFYLVGNEIKDYSNDLTTSQKFTGSAAFILGKKGLINIDYTYNDYGSAKLGPEKSFSGENAYINNEMQSTSTIKIGGETRINDLSLRAGFRYQQSPFKNETFKPYGDLTSYSVGVGYNMKNFYIDAAYSFSQRDRNYLLSGIYYNNGASVDFQDLIPGATNPKDRDLQAAGQQALRVNTFDQANNGLDEDGRGYAMSIQDITKTYNNFSLTVGLRF